MTADERARDLALDVTRSFIVQAPAGSGKTELLIQRYLALLGRASLPEEILAITFTRKAAAEMRQRVLGALADAEAEPATDAPHKRTTHKLATVALARSRALDWELDVQPQRLRIETVDSLNAWLARHLSILSGGIGAADLVEDPAACYGLAVARILDCAGETSGLGTALTQVLRSADNSPARLERMLRELLPTRDQWLPYLASGDDRELRRTLELAARRLVAETLQRLHRQLPVAFVDEVSAILRELAANELEHPGLAVWRDAGTKLIPAVESLDAWRAVPELLLTRAKAARFRKTWTAADGVDATAGSSMRQRLADLVAVYGQVEGLREALLKIRELPEPGYTEGDWNLVAALSVVLKYLVAELKVVFGERHCADFVEVALSAQQALGRVDAPSELLLALDRRLAHILVDEFQDTSHTQFRLLKLLTSGWQAGDGRTLFLVGDPMQSIYRFRHADMSLFLKAQVAGVGDVALTPLVLERNFRSTPAIVDWVNATFAAMFPATDDMGAGVARFNPCRATRGREPGPRVHWHALRGGSASAEAERVTEILRAELRARPHGATAVLVRSRSHLAGLQAQLAAAGIPARAVEVEAPNQRQVIQDLLGLTRALVHLGDRLAWLAVLRAPWCGLGWRDLEVVACASSDASIWAVLQTESELAELSEEGRARLQHVRAILEQAFAKRATQAFDRWIERTWIDLAGPSLARDDDMHHVMNFFATLASLADRGDVPDPTLLERHFMEPYGQGEAPHATGVEIMTIHRSKGLEFDTVILLGLARRPRADQGRGLYWHERTAADGQEDFLLGPFGQAAEASSLTTFIRRADAARDIAESMRLLYVATTRARERLHLVARLDEQLPTPQAGSLLAHLWAQARPHFEEAAPAVAGPAEPIWVTPSLRRLRGHRVMPACVGRVDESSAEPEPEFQWVSYAAVQVGTVVHEVLHEIATEGLERWTDERIDGLHRRFRGRLALLGVEPTELDAAVQRTVDALRAILKDRQGRWLLSAHAEAVSELPITLHTARGLEHLRIDRTFVDEAGLRWIVDFKTSQHGGGALEAFLDTEAERYRPQLTRYAAALAQLDDRPIRVALYFPLLQAFRAWEPEL